MKKSQILAALALAFALGVVAPVAGSYAIDARVSTGETTSKEASDADLRAATAYVKTAAYNAYANLATAYEAAGAITTANDISNVNANLKAAVAGFDGVTTTSGNNRAALIANIASAKNAFGGNYENWVALVNAIADATTPATVATKGEANIMSAIKTAMNNLGYTFNLEEGDKLADTTTNVDGNDVTTKGVVSVAKELINNKLGAGAYDQYAGLVNAIAAAAKTDTVYGDLETALKNGNLKDAEAIAESLKDAVSVADLKTIVTTDVKGADAWKNVADKVTAIEAILKNSGATSAQNKYLALDNEADNNGLLQLFNTASGAKTTYAQLISGATPTDPETPGQNPEDPTNPEQPGDDTKDPSAPGTGIVSATEGSAATTVSIVAGLATALTALGAGVVAYRSARRSNK